MSHSDYANQDDSAYEESDVSISDDESDEEVEFPGMSITHT